LSADSESQTSVENETQVAKIGFEIGSGAVNETCISKLWIQIVGGE